jgi:hypothetical protein
MTDQLRQDAQQALEALETCREDEWHSEDDFGMEQTYDEDKVAKALTALRTTLKQPPLPVQEPMRVYVENFAAMSGWVKDSGEGAFNYVQRISYAQGVEDATAHARPVQEPVACRFCYSEKGCWTWQCYHCGEIDDVQKPAAQPVQKPLTHDEIEVIGDKVANEQLVGPVANFRVRFARAIEARLKEKT